MRNLLKAKSLSFPAQARKAIFLAKKFFGLKLIKLFVILIFIFITAPLILFIILRPKTHQNITYGTTFSNRYATELGLDWKDAYVKTLDDLGIQNIRLVAYWDEIEIVRGTYDYSHIKWQLDEAEKRNTNVILAVGRKVPRFPECFEPYWWTQITDVDKRDELLFKYVSNTVAELKKYKSIKMWQVENEPFFPFGNCLPTTYETVKAETNLVRNADDRPILIQDSGEGGFWKPSYILGDYLGISMYRKIWFDFWGLFLGKFVYFQYPLAHWTYKIKADLRGIPYQKVIITELQAEPWGPGINSSLTEEDKAKTMSKEMFLSTISYAQEAGFKDIYFWGTEWWLWEKEKNANPFFWDTAKAIIK